MGKFLKVVSVLYYLTLIILLATSNKYNFHTDFDIIKYLLVHFMLSLLVFSLGHVIIQNDANKKEISKVFKKIEKSSKGFTLIELLAVIVILAVILLVSIPIINNIIVSVKIAALENSANLIIDNIEMNNAIKENKKSITYIFESGEQIGTIKLDINNSVVKEGYINVTKTGEIALVISDGHNILIKDFNQNTITKSTTENTTVDNEFQNIMKEFTFVINNKVIISHRYFQETRYVSGSTGTTSTGLVIEATDDEGNFHRIEHDMENPNANGDIINETLITTDLKGVFVPKVGIESRFEVTFYHELYDLNYLYNGEIKTINIINEEPTTIFEGLYDWTSSVGGIGDDYFYRYYYTIQD